MDSAIEPQMKICNKCGKSLPTTNFYKKKDAKDGLQSVCIDCRKMYLNQRKKSVKHEFTGNLPLKGNENSPLKNFTPRELIEELKSRGYRGELHFDYVVKL